MWAEVVGRQHVHDVLTADEPISKTIGIVLHIERGALEKPRGGQGWPSTASERLPERPRPRSI